MPFLHRNSGHLSKARRRVFEELDDQEIQRIEEEYRRAFTDDQTMEF